MRSHAILEVWGLLSIGVLNTAGALFFLNSEDLLAAAHRCGSTLVLVTHDERLQARLARHLRLEDGRLLA